MKAISLSAIVYEEDSGYVSLCPELDIASQGDAIDEAVANLKEAVEGFFECADQKEIHRRFLGIF